MNKDPYEKIMLKKCSVCEHEMLSDKRRNGKCENCGWVNQNIFDNSKKYSDTVVCPNLIPLNKSKQVNLSDHQ